MRYQSINEIEQFSFQDCELVTFEISEKQISMTLEALLVMPGNSQNTNYTMSYAHTTYARLQGAKIISAVKDGYRYYDANDNLLEEIADQKLGTDQISALPALFKNSYFYDMKKKSENDGIFTYEMHIELPNQSDDEYDNSVTDSYTLEVSFEKAIFEWDNYMNKAQL